MKGTRPILFGILACVTVFLFSTVPTWSQEVNDLSPTTQYSITITKSIKEEPNWHPTPMTQEEIINFNVETICADYGVDPALVKSIIWHESRYNPNASNGNCLGLMQISTRWHSARAERLGVDDFYDIRGNILLGVDYISELLNNCHDPALALMAYNMGHARARELYNAGYISNYAQSVLEKAKDI